MSGYNSNRNQSISYSEVNSQKTLIYDLRSQLSNLKSQFSRLISRPADPTSKSKIQQKSIIKSRYSCVPSDTDAQSNLSISSQNCVGTRSQDFSSQPNLLHPNKTQNNIDHKNIPVIDKLNINYRRSSNHQVYTSPTLPAYVQQQKPNNQQKKGNSDVYPKKQFATFYKKTHQNIYQTQGKNHTTSNVLSKICVNNLSAVESNLNQQLNNAQQKIKKLQQQNLTNSTKCNNSQKQICQLQANLTKISNQLKEQKAQGAVKNEKIKKLEEQIKQFNLKSSKANQQTVDLIKQKNKQIQAIKQGQLQQLKNQQKNYQNLLSSEKQNLQTKADSVITSIKQQYQKKLKQFALEKQKLIEQNSLNKQNNLSMKAQICQLQTKKQISQKNLNEKLQQIKKQNEIIKSLLTKQSQLQKQIKQKFSKPQSKQIGVITEQQLCVQSVSNQQQNQVNQANQAVVNTNTPSAPITTQPQYKQMQDKLTIYLNNIDKQSQKIKQQKAQIQKLVKKLDDNNRIVSQKQLAIRNLMRDCKALQKDLNQNRRMRRQLDILLEQSTINLTKLNLRTLNNKYKNIQEQGK